jgi:uncharacterized protein (DUF2235 family)
MDRKPPMRHILLFDGTWNTPSQRDRGKPAPTNVWRISRAISTSAGDQQRVAYFRGVGRGWGASIGVIWRLLNSASGRRLDSVFGGASGWGMSGQIRAAYKNLVLAYKPGDEIFVFGFSRGAYAARSFIGLLHHAGLLQRDARGRIRRVMRAYHRLLRSPHHKAYIEQCQSLMHRGVRVRFLGVWDTVGALGAPVFGGEFSLNPLPLQRRFHDINALDDVDEAYHALAMDELRASFLPKLFSAGCGARYFEQAWFRGVHANVGGGYCEVGLSNRALEWMVKKATTAGLRLIPNQPSLDTNAVCVLRDNIGSYWRAGLWPRWFPITTNSTAPDDAGWGYLHQSVQQGEIQNEPRGAHLVDLSAGQQAESIEINAQRYWNNTWIVLRAGATYRLRVIGQWKTSNQACGPEGVREKAAMGRARARPGELVLLVNAPMQPEKLTGRLWNALYYVFCETPQLYVACLNPWSTLREEDVDEREFSPTRTGVLHCFANASWAAQSQNIGRVTLQVRRLQ